MNVYSFSQARQKFAAVLDDAQRQGVARIKRRDGSIFDVTPVRTNTSPLDVSGVDLGLGADEIVEVIRETRSRG